MIDFATASARYGFGARPDDRQDRDVRRELLGQLDRYEARPEAYIAAPTRTTVSADLIDYLEKTRAGRMAMKQGARPSMAEDADPAASAATVEQSMKVTQRYARQVARSQYVALIGARANAALITPSPFVERLVHFWANHFAISAEKITVTALGGLLEAEAIRPHVLGKFGDMLQAVERHPAMLLYLDQAQSIGPDSPIGRQRAARGGRKVGLNENLAREIMELHTLGVRAGYSQADVTELARALTGWTVAGLAGGLAQRALGVDAAPGAFAFARPLHQPGARMIMGRRYAEGGEAQASAILADLATHPKTAKYVATKLARHFTSDTPPPALVERLSASFLKTGGQLSDLYRILIDAPEVAASAGSKFKTPWDWWISAARATGAQDADGRAVAAVMRQLGQPVWQPGSPAGFDDVAASWAGPDALMRRAEVAARMATRAGEATFQISNLAKSILPSGGRATTLAALARAESSTEGLSMLLVAPEFMRR
jgi:uncharacterized protein (DUF1800 family)